MSAAIFDIDFIRASWEGSRDNQVVRQTRHQSPTPNAQAQSPIPRPQSPIPQSPPATGFRNPFDPEASVFDLIPDESSNTEVDLYRMDVDEPDEEMEAVSPTSRPSTPPKDDECLIEELPQMSSL